MRIPIDSLPPLPDELPLLPGGVPDTSTSARTRVNAQLLWRAAHAIAAERGLPADYQTVPGRKWQVDMSAVLKRAFTSITNNDESKQARNDLYRWLRETRNMVCIQRLGYAGGIWWVADEWNHYKAGSPAPAESALSTFAERRLRPEEAGEYKDPLPVIAGFRCSVPGCPDTQVFPHAGALAEHRAQAHHDEAPAELVEAEIAEELLLTPGEVVQLEAALDEPETPEFSQEELARRVWDAIRAAGLTQKQVGEVLGLHNSSVSSMITGRQRISVEQIFGISRATGADVSALLGLPAPAGILSEMKAQAPAETPVRALLSEVASRVEAMEAEARDLRAKAGDGEAVREMKELIAELREEIAMHLRTIAEQRADVHRARKLLGKDD